MNNLVLKLNEKTNRYSNLIGLFTLLTMLSTSLIAQETVKTLGYNYYGEKINEKAICSQFNYRTKEIAIRVVDEIVKRSGLVRNFYIMECPNTDNCFAAVQGETRLLVYDGGFMQRANALAKTEWGAISIMAHEIGHHLQGHTIIHGGSDPEKELQADFFSGSILYKMGATLEEAQAAISKLTSDYDGGTHPPRGKRLAKIKEGWESAKKYYPVVNKIDLKDILKKQEVETVPVKETPAQKAPQPAPRRQPAPDNNTVNVGSVEKPVDNVNKVPQKYPEQPSNTPEEGVLGSSNVDNSNINAKKCGCIDGDCNNGLGKMVNTKTEEVYYGEWKNGKREGRGTEFYADGSKKYVGNFSQSKYQGNGTYYYKNGDSYIGKFRNGLMNDDKGYFIFANNTRLVARIVDGKKQGKAMRIYQDGRREETYFENDTEKFGYKGK